jgi:threonylcarbamoyladenosine tRNA methylthiotransferase MtaB
VAAVVGNSHKALAPEIILGLRAALPPPSPRRSAPRWLVWRRCNRWRGSWPIWADDRFAHSFPEGEQIAPGAQTRPNLKIQEGCGNRCTFCVIPQTRGASRSLPAAAVLRQVEGFVAAGGKELVLSGINLGRWGRGMLRNGFRDSLPGLLHKTLLDSREIAQDGAREPFLWERIRPSPSATLAGLVRQIFARTALARLRLSSIEPMDWDAELIGLMAEFGGGRLARHAHLPLQSGSDAVLRRMHRRYRPWHYAEKVAALGRAAGPELTLGADVMVGFPGETDASSRRRWRWCGRCPSATCTCSRFRRGRGRRAGRCTPSGRFRPRRSRSGWLPARAGCGKEPVRTGGALWAGSWRPSRCTRRRK